MTIHPAMNCRELVSKAAIITPGISMRDVVLQNPAYSRPAINSAVDFHVREGRIIRQKEGRLTKLIPTLRGPSALYSPCNKTLPYAARIAARGQQSAVQQTEDGMQAYVVTSVLLNSEGNLVITKTCGTKVKVTTVPMNSGQIAGLSSSIGAYLG